MADLPKKPANNPKRRYVPPTIEVVELSTEQALLSVCAMLPDQPTGSPCGPNPQPPFAQSAVALFPKSEGGGEP